MQRDDDAPFSSSRRDWSSSRPAGRSGLPLKSRTSQPEIIVTLDDNRLAGLVFGQFDQHLAHIERRLNVIANARGNKVALSGEAAPAARKVILALYERARAGEMITPGDIDGVIQEVALQGNLFGADDGAAPAHFRQVITRKRGVRARNAAQDDYLRALQDNELVIAEGPAGTGKTWLAVGHAVSQLEQGAVERIILSRPAVEAGERLGFLPGDMREKIDPYLRPVYDALYDFMDARTVERGLATGMIEIAPLAFMRGRTLSRAAILLDEAQNCTTMQMKMFLTRLGEGSRMIVTGDPSQIDLPPGQQSGLVQASRILREVEGVGHVRFSEGDVVRHDLVRRIVAAYEEDARAQAARRADEHVSGTPE
ncbi:PhoH family protein [Camelimonas abortus]|uniref:PhoH-like protein n=1 Tax=Camelimonas abortus TaxID=1017184 RepID=A0ABV7LCL3_9HYPH